MRKMITFFNVIYLIMNINKRSGLGILKPDVLFPWKDREI